MDEVLLFNINIREISRIHQSWIESVRTTNPTRVLRGAKCATRQISRRPKVEYIETNPYEAQLKLLEKSNSRAEVHHYYKDPHDPRPCQTPCQSPRPAMSGGLQLTPASSFRLTAACTIRLHCSLRP